VRRFRRCCEHKYADAEAVCTRGIEKGLGNAELHRLRLYVDLRQGNIDIIARDSEYLAAHGPDEADTHARTADIYLVSGNSAAAIDSCKRALELDPYSRRHFPLALACLFAGQYDAAEAAYEEGLKGVNAFELQIALSELEFWSERWSQRVSEPRFARIIAQFRERLEDAGRLGTIMQSANS
jgi:tetratricopeptide (TPR) repeat protein